MKKLTIIIAAAGAAVLVGTSLVAVAIYRLIEAVDGDIAQFDNDDEDINKLIDMVSGVSYLQRGQVGDDFDPAIHTAWWKDYR